MPLTGDEKDVGTASDTLKVLRDLAGPHPGKRPAHAKGLLLKGTFKPTPLAASLSTAQHFNTPETPVIARLSNSGGNPDTKDNDPGGLPKGLAVRFMLAETPRRVHTDTVAHSADGFPGTNGQDALEFFQALKNGTIGEYLGTHPAAMAFIQIPKPFPASFASERFYGVNAFKFIAKDGKETFVRYRFEPVAGYKTLTEEEGKAKSDYYLFDEFPALLKTGPIEFKYMAQIAEAGDVTNDANAHWPTERKIVDLGIISLTATADDQDAQQKRIIFDPIPRDVEGIEPSDDPLLIARENLYLLSGRERRAA